MTGNIRPNIVRSIFLGVLAAAMIFGSTAPASSAENPEQFFKGKKITVIIPYSVGGGFDFYARLVGKYMEKNIPDSTFIPLNVTGAGGLLGSNRLYTSKPDGLTIGLTNTGGLVFNQILGGEGVKFDLNRFGWIGRITAEQHVFVTHAKFPYDRLADVKKAGKKLRLGFNGVGSDDYFAASVILHTMDIPYEMITGYQGSKEVVLGVLREEIDGTSNTISSVLPQVKSAEFKVLVKYGEKSDLVSESVQDVMDLVGGEKKKLVQAISAIFTLDRSMAAPPGVPEKRLAYLRAAFDKAVKDPGLLGEAQKAKRPMAALPGQALLPRIQDALKAGDTLKSILKESLAAGGK